MTTVPAYSITLDDDSRVVAFHNEATEEHPESLTICGLPGAPDRIRLRANQFKAEGDQRPDFWSRSHVAWVSATEKAGYPCLNVKATPEDAEPAYTRLLRVMPRED